MLSVGRGTVPYSNSIWPGLTEFGPADREVTLSASASPIGGTYLLSLAKFLVYGKQFVLHNEKEAISFSFFILLSQYSGVY